MRAYLSRIFQPCFFPTECINRRQISHQKLWKINIIAFSKTLSKVSFISSPHCHKRSNKNVFLFPAKRPPHVLSYATLTILFCFISSKKNIFFCIFRDNVMEYICQLSYKLGRRIEIKLAAFPETLAGMRNQ